MTCGGGEKKAKQLVEGAILETAAARPRRLAGLDCQPQLGSASSAALAWQPQLGGNSEHTLATSPRRIFTTPAAQSGGSMQLSCCIPSGTLRVSWEQVACCMFVHGPAQRSAAQRTGEHGVVVVAQAQRGDGHDLLSEQWEQSASKGQRGSGGAGVTLGTCHNW